MVTTYRDKVKLQAWISKDVYEELESLIKIKYKGFRGALSAEVEAALRAWLSTHRDTQGNLKVENGVNPLPRYYKVFQQCKRFISQRYGVDFDEVHQVPLRMLREAIEFVRGNDPRTVKKWLRTFEKQHLIKYIGPELVEVRG